ncbi:AbrB/MazE/SpoVT family DNA-binding domain-containing protein [Fredinandcohnia humi]
MIFEASKVLPIYQITLPKEVREHLNVSIGCRIILIETEDGFLLKKVNEQVVNKIMEK